MATAGAPHRSSLPTSMKDVVVDKIGPIVKQIEKGLSEEDAPTFDLSYTHEGGGATDGGDDGAEGDAAVANPRSGNIIKAVRRATGGDVWDPSGIEKLDCSGSELTDATFSEVLGLLPSVKQIELLDCGQLTAQSLTEIGEKCRSLEQLFAQDCQGIDDGALSAIAAGCPQLSRVTISQCKKVTESGLIALATGAKALEWLEVAETEAVTDASFGAICSCARGLMWLDVSKCPNLTDAGVDSISAAAELQTLTLRSNPQLTDKGIASLLANKSHSRGLEDLHIGGCHGITAKTKAKLQAERPTLNITTDVDSDGDFDMED